MQHVHRRRVDVVLAIWHFNDTSCVIRGPTLTFMKNQCCVRGVTLHKRIVGVVISIWRSNNTMCDYRGAMRMLTKI